MFMENIVALVVGDFVYGDLSCIRKAEKVHAEM